MRESLRRRNEAQSTFSTSIVTCWLIVFVICSATTAIPENASAEPPTTRPSDLPKGQPAWFKLDTRSMIRKGEEEKVIFSVSRKPQWFSCYDHPVTRQEYQAYMTKIGERMSAADQTDRAYSLADPLPYPKGLEDVSDDDRGVRLSLRIEAEGDSPVLDFTLLLTSSRRGVWSDVDWRPFLFTFFVDGKPVLPEPSTGYFGGMQQQSVFLIPVGGGERRWKFRVDADSVQKLLPDQQAHTLAIVAAFSEREAKEKHDKEFDGNPLPPQGHEGPQVLVRSNIAEIKWTANSWINAEAKR